MQVRPQLHHIAVANDFARSVRQFELEYEARLNLNSLLDGSLFDLLACCFGAFHRYRLAVDGDFNRMVRGGAVCLLFVHSTFSHSGCELPVSNSLGRIANARVAVNP